MEADNYTPEPYITIEDFCGTIDGIHSEHWCDWYPESKVAQYGGDWNEIPDMPSDTQPTLEQVRKWVKEHSD